MGRLVTSSVLCPRSAANPRFRTSRHLDVAVIPVGIDYVIRAGATQLVFLRHLERRRLVGRRSPVNGQVLIPPRGACTASGARCVEEVEVKSSGVVTTFSVIRIEFPGQRLKPPYVCAAILLDGADVPLIHLVGGDPDAVRMGMRVRAVWTDERCLDGGDPLL